MQTEETVRLVEEISLVESAKKIATSSSHEHHHHDHNCEDAGCGHDHSDGHHHHHGDHHHEHEHSQGPAKRTFIDRLRAIAEISLSDFIDISAFLIIGAILASLISTSFPRSELEKLGNESELSIVAMMVLAILLSLCSEADAFVSANFRGLSTGAKLAMIVLGPMLDVKLFIMYRWVFTNRMVWTMIPVIIVMIFGLCYGYDWIEPLIIPATTTPGTGG